MTWIEKQRTMTSIIQNFDPYVKQNDTSNRMAHLTNSARTVVCEFQHSIDIMPHNLYLKIKK